MNYALSTTLHATFDDAVERTRKALSDQGFGVLNAATRLQVAVDSLSGAHAD